jgi:hypothetical protein
MTNEQKIQEMKELLFSWQEAARQQGRTYSESVQACNDLQKEIEKLQKKEMENK